MNVLKHLRVALSLPLFSVCFLPPVHCPADPLLVALRMGDGAHGLTNTATSVFLQPYRLDGTALPALLLPLGQVRPLAPPFHLMDSGSTDAQGQLTRAVNGTLLQIPGYNATNGEVDVVASSSQKVLRTIGLFKPGQVVDTSRAVSMLNSNNYRSVVSVDGSSFWAAGKGGVFYVNGSAVTQLSDLNFRCINIFNGQLFCTYGGSTPGLYTVGSGLPVSAPAQPYIFLAMPGASPSPFAFQMNTAMNVCYIADDGTNAGIVKFTYNGGVWSSNYTLKAGGPFGARGLAVDWSRPGVPVVYATTAETSSNRVVRIVDTGAASAASQIAQAPRHTVFRGLDIFGLPAVWRYATGGNWSVGGTTPWYNWSVCVANGSMLQFQNVNTGTSPLSLSVTNNTALSRFSGLSFTSSGYGTGPETSYTVRGNALTLSDGISSETTVNQTIRCPVALSAAQAFESGPGNLIIDGVLSGSEPLSKTGAGGLYLNATNKFSGAVIVYSGSLIVNGVLTNTYLAAVNATLAGTGTITGPVTIQSGGTLSPGLSNTLGSLTIRGDLDLLGATSIQIGKLGTNCLSSRLAGVSTLNAGGTLNVTLEGATLQAGDSFKLFDAAQYTGNFAVLNLPPPGQGLFWDTSNLLTAGTLTLAVIAPPVMAPLSYQANGTVLLHFAGSPGLSYEVWGTGAFSWGWTLIGTGTFPPDGLASFYDWQAQFYPDQRFYRISVP